MEEHSFSTLTFTVVSVKTHNGKEGYLIEARMYLHRHILERNIEPMLGILNFLSHKDVPMAIDTSDSTSPYTSLVWLLPISLAEFFWDRYQNDKDILADSLKTYLKRKQLLKGEQNENKEITHKDYTQVSY